jgi:hypothetical protein
MPPGLLVDGAPVLPSPNVSDVKEISLEHLELLLQVGCGPE